MQGRIINFFKDLIKTIKNELKGPKIKKKSIEEINAIINNYQFTNEKEPVSIELNSNINISSYDSQIKTEIKSSEFKVEISEIDILEKDNVIDSNNIELGKYDLEIKNLEIDEFNKELETYEMEIIKLKASKIDKIKVEKTKTKVYAGDRIMMNFPLLRKGKVLSEYRPSELHEINEKIKKSLRVDKLYDYKIERIFENVPVDCIKEVKYYQASGSIHIFLRNNKESRENSLVVLRDLVKSKLVKIFI